MKIANVNLGFNVGTLAIGVGAYLFGPMILSAVGGALRGVAKAGIKSGMIAYSKGKTLAEEARESMEDLAAEAKSEVKALEEKTPAKKARASK